MSNSSLDLYFIDSVKKQSQFSELTQPNLFYYVNICGYQLTIDRIPNRKKSYCVKTQGFLFGSYVDTVHVNHLAWTVLDYFGSLNEALKVFNEGLDFLVSASRSHAV